MDTNTINEYLLELVQETSQELIKIYYGKPNRKTLLKIPPYRNTSIRISEQEMRFVLLALHEQFSHPGFGYSVETPTQEKYSFSGEGSRSAASDLSFYNDDEVILNVEFKVHMPNQKAVNKDISKLVKEKCNGAWIHILKNEDSGTVKALFEKLETAFKENGPSENPISFHILILQTQTLLSRKGKDSEKHYTKGIFNISYSLWKHLDPGKYHFKNGKKLTVGDSVEDWQVDKFNIL